MCQNHTNKPIFSAPLAHITALLTPAQLIDPTQPVTHTACSQSDMQQVRHTGRHSASSCLVSSAFSGMPPLPPKHLVTPPCSASRACRLEAGGNALAWVSTCWAQTQPGNNKLTQQEGNNIQTNQPCSRQAGKATALHGAYRVNHVVKPWI